MMNHSGEEKIRKLEVNLPFAGIFPLWMLRTRQRNKFLSKEAGWRERRNFFEDNQTPIDGYRGFSKQRSIKFSVNPHCEDCGQSFDLQVHHINGLEDGHILENLRTLCVDCHRTRHKHYISSKYVHNRIVKARGVDEVL